VGPLVEPGTYSVTVEVRVGGDTRQLTGPTAITVVPLEGAAR